MQVIIANKMISELTVSLINPMLKAIAEAAIIKDSRDEINMPPPRVCLHVNLSFRSSAGTILTINATAKSHMSSMRP